MDFLEIKLPWPEPEKREILTAILADYGFESFIEEEEHLLAYTPGKEFDDEAFGQLISGIFEGKVPGYEVRPIRERNWNLKWEKDYVPVNIQDKVRVRAPFHQPEGGFRHDIIIEPQMSFGTAHHETTRLMLEMMGDLDVQGKKVLDMGCGTGILAIYANKLGASDVIAVDNDEWAYNNTLHNIELNDTRHVIVLMGDATSLTGEQFGGILANINRNVLIDDIPVYDRHLEKGGWVLLSGYYEADLPMVSNVAEKFKWSLQSERSLNNWVAALFIKE